MKLVLSETELWLHKQIGFSYLFSIKSYKCLIMLIIYKSACLCKSEAYWKPKQQDIDGKLPFVTKDHF